MLYLVPLNFVCTFSVLIQSCSCIVSFMHLVSPGHSHSQSRKSLHIHPLHCFYSLPPNGVILGQHFACTVCHNSLQACNTSTVKYIQYLRNVRTLQYKHNMLNPIHELCNLCLKSFHLSLQHKGLKLGQVQSFDQLWTNCNCNWL